MKPPSNCTFVVVCLVSILLLSNAFSNVTRKDNTERILLEVVSFGEYEVFPMQWSVDPEFEQAGSIAGEMRRKVIFKVIEPLRYTELLYCTYVSDRHLYQGSDAVSLFVGLRCYLNVSIENLNADFRIFKSEDNVRNAISKNLLDELEAIWITKVGTPLPNFDQEMS